MEAQYKKDEEYDECRSDRVKRYKEVRRELVRL